MTSANTVEYTIFKNGERVGRHSQNVMCKTCNDGLEQFQPASDFTIQSWGHDEDEEEWEGEEEPLQKWIEQHPAQVTFRRFSDGESVRLNKKRGDAVIVQSAKGKWFMSYTVRLLNGEIMENISQTEILPQTLKK